MKIAPFAIACLFIFTSFYTFLDGYDPYLEYDLDEMNEFWDSYENHSYPKRTYPNQQSVEIADKIIANDEIYLLRYWDPVVIPKSSIDWSEDPFGDWTWQFYYHSLRMVSYLVSSYEFTGEISYLQEAKWYIESWIEHNPSPRKQASERAWDDHSTANRILTFIQFWDSYRDSSIADESFSILFLNILRLHGDFTADSENYFWGHNHGIFQDRALAQLSVMFPNFEESNDWNKVANERLNLHFVEDFTDSGIHKEHSPSYHFLVLSLLMSINEFNIHYGINNDELEILIPKMQDYLSYIVKPDGTFPLVGDSGLENGLRLKESSVVSQNLLNLMTMEDEDKLGNYCIGYHDSGVGINKLELSNGHDFYFAIFSAFHNTVHKHSDDLSFVLTYGNTDYFVDSGKFNFVESNDFRQYVRSVFAHNSIIVDNISYDNRDIENTGKSMLYDSECNQNYSFFQAKHTFYDGIEIYRNVVIVYDKGVFIHDLIIGDEEHDYSQIFQIGNNVEIEIKNNGSLSMDSKIDNTSINLHQIDDIISFESTTGSLEPIRGWRSENFNEIDEITTIAYFKSGETTEFQTLIEFDDNILDVEVTFIDGFVYDYKLTDEEGNLLTVLVD